MNPGNETKTGNRCVRSQKNRSPDGINLGILWDDYLAMPVSAKEEVARHRCLLKLAKAQARDEARSQEESF